MQNLLLLHGALGYGKQFDDLRTLLEDDYNIFSPDFIGHGGREVPNSLSIQDFALEIKNYIENAIGGETHIFGHSMGGYVAMYMAANGMAPIGKIMTLGTKQLWNPDIAANEARMLNAEKIKEKVPAFAQMLQEMHGNEWESLCQKTAEMLIDMGNNPPLTEEDYGHITQPIQISIGDKDRMVSLEETISVFRKIKTARLLVMPATPHPYDQVDVHRLAYKINSYFSDKD